MTVFDRAFADLFRTSTAFCPRIKIPSPEYATRRLCCSKTSTNTTAKKRTFFKKPLNAKKEGRAKHRWADPFLFVGLTLPPPGGGDDLTPGERGGWTLGSRSSQALKA